MGKFIKTRKQTNTPVSAEETTNVTENSIAFIYVFRNELAALLGDDKAFTIYEVDEPLPDDTIDMRPNQHTLNIVCSDVVKLAIARDHIGDTFEDGEVLNIDYYYTRDNKTYANAKDRPTHKELNTNLDLATLFEGNPHFSKLYSGYGASGPWYCIAFKPELIQYYTEDMTALHGNRSCAMEDIARDIFTKPEDSNIYFSTENIKDFPTAQVINISAKDFGCQPLTGYNTELYSINTATTASAASAACASGLAFK